MGVWSETEGGREGGVEGWRGIGRDRDREKRGEEGEERGRKPICDEVKGKQTSFTVTSWGARWIHHSSTTPKILINYILGYNCPWFNKQLHYIEMNYNLLTTTLPPYHLPQHVMSLLPSPRPVPRWTDRTPGRLGLRSLPSVCREPSTGMVASCAWTMPATEMKPKSIMGAVPRITYLDRKRGMGWDRDRYIGEGVWRETKHQKNRINTMEKEVIEERQHHGTADGWFKKSSNCVA